MLVTWGGLSAAASAWCSASEVVDKGVLDAAIVGAAQSVEHYEIARYGTLIAWAEADQKLSTVALRKGVNRKAAS